MPFFWFTYIGEGKNFGQTIWDKIDVPKEHIREDQNVCVYVSSCSQG